MLFRSAVKNIRNCLAKCHINVRDFIVSSYASGLASLTDDEKEIGVTCLDIGAGNTSIAIFSEGYPIYFDSIPVGGLHITKDIALGLSVSQPFAERLKVIYGSAVSTDSDDLDRIDLADENEAASISNKAITKAELTAIIKPRVEEILEMAKANLEKSGLYGAAGNKVVITGGSSQLQGIKEITSYIFNKHVRVAKPQELQGIPESAKGAAFSTAVGMLIHAAKNKEVADSKTIFNPMDIVNSNKKTSGKSNWVVEWFKKNF
ncbi:MAG TPA: cell division protein FtsA [Alphaproteobacteria bacterium]|nr:cell division protein FtsA [Alphaproteobacteria bacterium]